MQDEKLISGAPYQICTKLVLDTSDPTISFDQEGVCHQYHDFLQNIAPRWDCGPDGRAKLEAVVAQIKKDGRGKDFDCIIGMSGGADSSYMLHVMVKEFGLRPLVFHVDAGWNSELAVHNIDCMVSKLKLDLFTEVVDWAEVRDFQLAMFKSGLPNIDSPQDIAFIGVLFQYAKKFDIKYIMNGGNISTECVGYPIEFFYYADLTLIKDVLARFCPRKLENYPFTSSFYRKIYMPYVRGVQMIKPLNFIPYIKKSAMDELAAEYGWKPYKQKHFESRFTRFFEGYWLPARFGFDVRRVQFSSLILTGQMTREEALELLEEPPYDPDLIRQDYQYIANKLDIEIDVLKQYEKMPKKYFWDYKNRSSLYNLGERLINKISGSRRGGAF